MPSSQLESPDSKTIQSFFNSIPKNYDTLNSFLSFSLDKLWRRALVTNSLKGTEQSILDIGAGTGTSLAYFLRARNFKQVVGTDFSIGMMKAASEHLKQKINFLAADLHQLPFQDNAFDLVTSSFVLRSVKNMKQFLQEVKRILHPNGKFAFLDLTRPKNPLFWNLVYRPYLKFYIPLIGQLISKNQAAYQFLSSSIQTFIEPADLIQMMKEDGFQNIQAKSLSFGAATIFLGEKRS